MKYFVLVLCILFSGVFSKTALKRNESDKDGITSPLLRLIIQQLNALGSRVEKLRDIANESQKEIISVKRDMADLKSKYGKFAIDKNDPSLDEINSKLLAVANKMKIDHLTGKLDAFTNHGNMGKLMKKMFNKCVISRSTIFDMYHL